ncbi:MAG: hypothetical protein Q4A32_07090 [Lachnospiraceae bacterium]|nr:hypothetical protein [Lachnospiraceae bacterium]
MKLTVKKVFLSIIALIVSISAAVLGMYMVFLAEMVFGYRLLFAAVFMFNPILTGFLIAYMFKKAEAAAAKEPKESGRKKKEKDEGHDEQPAYAAPISQQPPYAGSVSQQASYAGSVPQQASPVVQVPQQGAFAEPDQQYAAQTEADMGFGGDLPDSSENQTSGYDLPGSETYTNYSDTMNAGDEAGAAPTKEKVKSKLKFWESNKDS